MKSIPSERYEVPRSMMELALKRTMFLRQYAYQLSPEQIAVNAYMQGMTDAVDTINAKGKQ